jgi:hypothetical protein
MEGAQKVCHSLARPVPNAFGTGKDTGCPPTACWHDGHEISMNLFVLSFSLVENPSEKECERAKQLKKDSEQVGMTARGGKDDSLSCSTWGS